ncbi:MAG: DUF4920 domain-containing protein [Deltaproteobacteria bacterium]|nr:DUF4920 domain-containing protein [Deltaproteobacteria bacterium]
MLPRAISLLVLLPFLLLPACQTTVSTPAGGGGGDAVAKKAHDCSQHAEGEEGCGGDCGAKAEAKEGEGHDCSAGAGNKIEHPDVEKEVVDGTTVLKAGVPLGSTAGATEVTVQALLDEPEKFAGKVVKVTGDVSAMCHHKRGWFALVAPDKSGRNLRVLTAPSFLVPEGVIGMNASTEGVVELIEIPEEAARHYAKEHKLGDPMEIVGPQKQAVIRAAGAAFRQA